MHDVDALLAVEDLAHQVGGRPDAGRSQAELAGIGSRIGDKFLQRVEGGGSGRGEKIGKARHAADGSKGDRRVVRQGFVESGPDGEAARVAKKQSVAIGCRACDCGGADSAARTADVLDHDRLPEGFSHPAAVFARKHLGQAAGRVGHDELDRRVRKALRVGVLRERHEKKSQYRCEFHHDERRCGGWSIVGR